MTLVEKIMLGMFRVGIILIAVAQVLKLFCI